MIVMDDVSLTIAPGQQVGLSAIMGQASRTIADHGKNIHTPVGSYEARELISTMFSDTLHSYADAIRLEYILPIGLA